MELEGIRSFLAVARFRSISKAAASLFVTQPTMSLRLRRLEDGLGFPLFERGWQGVRLTRQGAYFLPYAAQLIHDLSTAAQVLGQPSSSTPLSFTKVAEDWERDQIMIGVDSWITSLVAKAVVDTFFHAVGDAFQIITRPAPTLIDLLELRRIDYAVFYSTSTEYPFSTRQLLRDRMVLVHRGDLDVQHGDGVRGALAAKPFVLFDNPVLSHHAEITSQLIDTYSDAEIATTELSEPLPDLTVEFGHHAESRRVESAGELHGALRTAMRDMRGD